MDDVTPDPIPDPIPVPVEPPTPELVILYRVFTHVPTGRLFPIDVAWDGTGTPSAAYIPDIAKDYGVPIEEIAATDSRIRPDFSKNLMPVPAPPPPPAKVDSPELIDVRVSAGLVGSDVTVPESVKLLAQHLLTLVEKRIS